MPIEEEGENLIHINFLHKMGRTVRWSKKFEFTTYFFIYKIKEMKKYKIFFDWKESKVEHRD